MKRKKVILSYALSAVLVFSSIGCAGYVSTGNAYAEETESGFVIKDGVLTRYTGTDTVVVIPEGVTSIGNEAFLGCSELTSIEIPEGVTSIGNRAFLGCSELTSIEIPEGVTSIGYSAFAGCSELTSIEIPKGVMSIGKFAFEGCNGLTSIKVAEENAVYDNRDNCNAIIETERNAIILGCANTKIPEEIESIDGYAFNGCSGLTEIEIPSNVMRIGEYTDFSYSYCPAFYECSDLTNIKVAEGNTVYDSRDNCNAIIKTERNAIILGCANTKIPEGIVSIDGDAFSGCSGLTEIEIPSSVTSIGDYGGFGDWVCAFNNCNSLTSIKVAEGNTVYDSRDNCNAVIETERNILIEGCANTKIPEGIVRIGNSAFGDCSGLTEIEIPSSVTSIANRAFCGCSGLTEIEIPSSVTSIGEEAFYCCSGLTTIKIPEGVEGLDDNTFGYCSSLTSIEIPSSVTWIDDAFTGSNKLEIIKGYTGSYAETYAKENGYKFIALDNPKEDEPTSSDNPIKDRAFYNVTGDDDNITLADAQMILKYALKIAPSDIQYTLADAQMCLKIALKIVALD